MSKVIRPHDPQWGRDFAAEAARLGALMGSALVRLHHIGSTAIPGLVAKPVIDMLAEAASLEAINARTRDLEAAGYEARGAYGIEGRRYFKKFSPDAALPRYHLHVYAEGAPHVARHLCFRDYLLLRPEVAQAYGALKVALTDPAVDPPPDYVAGKSAFVRDVEAAALAHFGRGPD